MGRAAQTGERLQ